MTLELIKVWFRYPNSDDYLFKELSITFSRNEITVITGPNGSGKTTLLKIAGLIYKPNKGVVKVFGKDFWKIDRHEERISIRRRIVYVHEKPILLKGTVAYNIAYGLILRGLNKKEAYNIVEDFTSKYGLSYLLRKKTIQLSAGEAQVVSLLRAMVLKPYYLLLDEPTSNLDIEKRQVILSIISDLKRQGTGIVITTHDTGIIELFRVKHYHLKEDRTIVLLKKK